MKIKHDVQSFVIRECVIPSEIAIFHDDVINLVILT